MEISKNVLVSIIVPLHNDERNIGYCLDSLMAQTYKNIEVIVIENGSRDRGYYICNEYATKDERIKLYAIEEAGVSKARNIGLDVSKGKYIFFCDTDDFMEKTMIERILQVLENSDSSIVICGYNKVNHHKMQDNLFQAMPISESWSRECFIERMFIDNSIKGAVWNKGFSKEIIGENRFDDTLSHCEDFYFIMQILSKNKDCKIRYINEKLYNYFTNPNSVTQDRTKTIDKDGNSKYVIAFKKMLDLSFSNEIKALIYASIYRDTVSALLCVEQKLLKNKKNYLYEDKRKYQEKYFSNKKIPLKEKIKMFIKLFLIKIGGK